jgi:nicotinate-nucleotide adenylyltransferase
MDTGILGGTFDPVHCGHLILAETVRTLLNLSEILFVPAGQPWLKSDRYILPARHRLAMLRLALAGKPYFKLSMIEVERAGPTYTVDTLIELRAQRPRDNLFFILGWDSLAQLPRWKEPARLITLCHMVAVPRPGFPPPDLAALQKVIPGLADRVRMLNEPHIDISATDIRQRVRQGLTIDGLVPQAVAAYIRENRLYMNCWEKNEGQA